VAFSKGPRACIALKYESYFPTCDNVYIYALTTYSVAYLELYLCLANFFTHLDMSLYDTDEKTIEWLDFGSAILRNHVKVTVDSIKYSQAN
jgi:hypothetical protein